MAEIRVQRRIEYRGDPDWVAGTLERSIQIGRPLRMGAGSITTLQITSEHEKTDAFADGHHRCARPQLVYIAGKFAGKDIVEHTANVEHAASYRARVAALGAYPVCPHTNTRDLGGDTGKCDDPKLQEFWYQGSLELLRRCDVLLLIPGWEESVGARREEQAARSWGIPVVEVYRDGDLSRLVEELGGTPLDY